MSAHPESTVGFPVFDWQLNSGSSRPWTTCLTSRGCHHPFVSSWGPGQPAQEHLRHKALGDLSFLGAVRPGALLFLDNRRLTRDRVPGRAPEHQLQLTAHKKLCPCLARPCVADVGHLLSLAVNHLSLLADTGVTVFDWPGVKINRHRDNKMSKRNIRCQLFPSPGEVSFQNPHQDKKVLESPRQ